MSLNTGDLLYTHKCNLHIITIALLSLVARVAGINNLMEYCEKLISNRLDEAPQTLPPLLDPSQNSEKEFPSVPQVMLDKVMTQLIFLFS